MNKGKNPLEFLEFQEIIKKLEDNGYGNEVAILMGSDECYTKKGRLNKCSTCRMLDCKSKKLEDMLKSMRELLKDDYE